MCCSGWDVPKVGVVPSAFPTGPFVPPQRPRHVWEEVQVPLLAPGGGTHHLPGADDSRDRGAPCPPLSRKREQPQVERFQYHCRTRLECVSTAVIKLKGCG